MGSAIVTSVDSLMSLRSERHSVVIELIILMRKNLCSELMSEEVSYEKEIYLQKLNILSS